MQRLKPYKEDNDWNKCVRIIIKLYIYCMSNYAGIGE